MKHMSSIPLIFYLVQKRKTNFCWKVKILAKDNIGKKNVTGITPVEVTKTEEKMSVVPFSRKLLN